MLQYLFDESRRMGHKMNTAKTKVMVVANTPINVNNVPREDIQRRIMAGWATYTKHRDIFKSNIVIYLKRHVYNSCVLPAMKYGTNTWTLAKQAHDKLAAVQTKMERCKLNITNTDRTSGSGR